jgi:hypothetical protein
VLPEMALEVARPEQAAMGLEARKTLQGLLLIEHFDLTSLRTRTRAEFAVGSRLHVEGFCRCFFQSADAPANASEARAGSLSHFGRKGSNSDVRRTRSASRHRCEPSSSSRASSILTEPSVLLQTGHVESCVPLSLCLRMNLRGCGAAKNGLFVASERPQR